MFLTELREKINPYHRKIEENVLLRKLMGPLTLTDYIDVLKKFYGFYVPLEAQAIPRFLKQNSVFQKFYFPKLPLLERDLKALATSSDAVMLCPFTPNPTNPFGWLGVFYTLEGSCLGRAMMWPNIQERLHLKSGDSFFSTDSHDLQNHWSAFCKNMSEQVRSEVDAQEVISGAIATFVALDEWFKK